MSDLVAEQIPFLAEVASFVCYCDCNRASCNGEIYELCGESGYEYMIEYDPHAVDISNMLIYLKNKDNVVFNGTCNGEHDIAQVLRMVIL